MFTRACQGIGSSFETSESKSRQAHQHEGMQGDLNVKLVGSAIEPWDHVGYLAAYYSALVVTTFVLIWVKWPKRRPEIATG